MNLRQWKKWENLRKRGKAYFVLMHGGFISGLSIAGVVTLITQLIHPIKFWHIFFLVYFVIFLFSGILVAIFVWNNNETKFLSENPPLPKRITRKNRFAK